MVLANTGMRSGEAQLIKWNYVEIKKSVPSQDKRTNYPNVHIHIPVEISKVRKNRTAIGMRGDIFQRIKTYSNHTNSHNYVFANRDAVEAVSRKTLYRLWEIRRKDSSIGDFVEDYSYYSLRPTIYENLLTSQFKLSLVCSLYLDRRDAQNEINLIKIAKTGLISRSLRKNFD